MSVVYPEQAFFMGVDTGQYSILGMKMHKTEELASCDMRFLLCYLCNVIVGLHLASFEESQLLL